MKIGIVCEGHSDRAVITNILKGTINFDSSDIIPLLPTDLYDETDKANKPVSSFGSWTSVKYECENRQRIDDFLLIEGHEFIIIHLDTAEAQEYGIVKPPILSLDYSNKVREITIQKINEWLREKEKVKSFLYAIAIEEIDAWVLAIYDSRNSSKVPNPKRRLENISGKMKLNTTPGYTNYITLSKDLSKTKIISDKKILARNESLSDFCQEINDKILPLLKVEAD